MNALIIRRAFTTSKRLSNFTSISRSCEHYCKLSIYTESIFCLKDYSLWPASFMAETHQVMALRFLFVRDTFLRFYWCWFFKNNLATSSAAPQNLLCQRMLGLNQWLLQRWHWQSDDLKVHELEIFLLKFRIFGFS